MPPSNQTEALDLSKFKFYSWGQVANNKAQSDTIVQVTPLEQLTHLDGELGSLPVELETEGKDAQGNAYTSKVTSDTAIECDWFPGFGVTNRRTAPDVRRGERVMIFSYADTDQYYWCTMGLDDDKRKLETVVYSWSGTTDEAKDGTEDGNCYSLEVSTHTGQITLKTSKQNKEFCLYAIQINAKEGRIAIVDDVDNEFMFDSKEKHLWMKNADGCLMELNKKLFHVYAPDEIHLEAVELVHVESKKMVVDVPTIEVNSETITVKNSDAIKVDTNSLEVNAQTVDVTAPQSTFTGNVTINGNLGVNGSFTMAGGGTGSFEGTVNFAQPITCNGITSSAPIAGPSDTI